MRIETRNYLAERGLIGAAYLYENHAHIATQYRGLNFAELSICALVSQCDKLGALRPEQVAFIAARLTDALIARNPMPELPAVTPPAPAVPPPAPAPTPPKTRPPGSVHKPVPALAW